MLVLLVAACSPQSNPNAPAVTGADKRQLTQRALQILKTDAPGAAKLFGEAAADGEHVVEKLETGIAIAYRHGVTLESLIIANRAVDIERLQPGMRLIIPGFPAAQFNLAAMHERGLGGLKADLAAAARWYQKSAEQGFTKAEFMMGSLCQRGQGGQKRDGARAREWYERAARKGMVEALYNLGTLYVQGGLVERDVVQAYKWYALAALRTGENERNELESQAYDEQSQGKLDAAVEAEANRRAVQRTHPDKAKAPDAELRNLVSSQSSLRDEAKRLYVQLRTDKLVRAKSELDEKGSAAAARKGVERLMSPADKAAAERLVAAFEFKPDTSEK